MIRHSSHAPVGQQGTVLSHQLALPNQDQCDLDRAFLAANHYQLEALLRRLDPQELAAWLILRDAETEQRIRDAVEEDRAEDSDDSVAIRDWKAQVADAVRERDAMADALRRVGATKGSPEARKIAAEALAEQTEATPA